MFNLFHIESTFEEIYYYTYNKRRVFLYTRAYWDKSQFNLDKVLVPAPEFTKIEAKGSKVATYNREMCRLCSREAIESWTWDTSDNFSVFDIPLDFRRTVDTLLLQDYLVIAWKK
jgi:hypothetical protein